MSENVVFVPAIVKIEENFGVHVVKLEERAKLPTRKYPADAGVDFYSLDSVELQPFSVTKVRTGIVVLIPPVTFGLLKPKGSSNWLVGAGVVDEGYTGEIVFKLYNPTSSIITILEGDPVGQMILIPIYKPYVHEITKEMLNEVKSERQSSGGIHNA